MPFDTTQPGVLAPIFDAAIERLMGQGRKAINPKINGASCRYRFEGAACLFGAMMSDEHYDPTIDHDGGDSMMASSPRVLSVIERSTGVDLASHLSPGELNSLQSIHDMHWQPGSDLKAIILRRRPDIYQKIWGYT